MSYAIQPVNRQIIIKVPKQDEEKKTESGLIIPISAQEKPYQGIVFKSDHVDYMPGDIVMYRKYSGFEFVLEKDEYLVIEAGDVLVRLVEEV